jgi:hypothetical protein
MKNLFILLLIALSFSACKKEAATKAPLIGVDPIPPTLISSDTLRTGGQWGLNIGEASPNVYAKFQSIITDKRVDYLAVVGNVFTNLESLENKIPLYRSVYLDETVGTGTGIQLNFTDNKLNSIFTNDGVRLTRWPIVNDAAHSVAVGDAIEGIYAKLTKIKEQGAYTRKFERISIFSKDITKAYDPLMNASPQWYFTSVIDEKHYTTVTLNFSAGKLASIYSTLFETTIANVPAGGDPTLQY